MRMTPAQKTKARATIISAAGRRFREAGLSGIGIDGLAAASGQSSGAIYAHFSSKTELFEEVVVDGLNRLIEGISMIRDNFGCRDPKWAGVFAERYLSTTHRNAVSDGCILPSLSVDITRGSEAVQHLYSRRIDEAVRMLAPGCSTADERSLQTAHALLSLVVGGIVLSRATTGGPANDMLEAARHAARRLLELEA